jgi:hypothetical protein
MRLGQPIGVPSIKVAMMETRKKRHYVFMHTDGKYYDEEGKELVKKYMGRPLKHIRITSPFIHRRFHPVLKRWKAHLGTDFGAKTGTPILAVADGKVIFSGWKGGYGNVIKIKHADGYVSLYAHQSRRKAKVGEYVSKGEVIGYVEIQDVVQDHTFILGSTKMDDLSILCRWSSSKAKGYGAKAKRHFCDERISILRLLMRSLMPIAPLIYGVVLMSVQSPLK